MNEDIYYYFILLFVHYSLFGISDSTGAGEHLQKCPTHHLVSSVLVDYA